MMVPVLAMLSSGSDSLRFAAGMEWSPDALPPRFALVPYASRTGWTLHGQVDREGRWPGGWLTVPAGQGLSGVGTIPAYRRLLALGWDPDLPALAATRRLLFRLLAEDRDPTLLDELRPKGDAEDEVEVRRQLLREAALAALAQAGQGDDPRVRGAARRLVDRLSERSGPSIHGLQALALLPKTRQEHAGAIERLLAWLQEPVAAPVKRVSGGPADVRADLTAVLEHPMAQLPKCLAWLELLARFGALDRHAPWRAALDQLLGRCDAHGLWTGGRVAAGVELPAWVWPMWGLVEPAGGAAGAAAQGLELSLRLARIARLAGRPLTLG